jgi:hypothetical protein
MRTPLLNQDAAEGAAPPQLARLVTSVNAGVNA